MRIDAPLGAFQENGSNTLQGPVDSINYPRACDKQCTVTYGLPGKRIAGLQIKLVAGLVPCRVQLP
jgi:hypothetical protein